MHVAVRNVVRHLPQRPAALAVRRVELLVCESGDRVAQRGGGSGDIVDPLLAMRVGDGAGHRRLADGVTELVECVHGGNHAEAARDEFEFLRCPVQRGLGRRRSWRCACETRGARP